MKDTHQPPGNATQRFSDRVDNYVKTRPGYPAEVFSLLREKCGLGPACVVADIGAGTGIFTKPLLESGATVHAIEPNAPMRAAMIAALGANPKLHAIDGTAENTKLSAASVDLVVAAQAFHWFDREAARREFERILKPRGWTALVWNTRLEDTTAFLVGYENMLRRWSTDYGKVNHRNVGLGAIAPFFAPGNVERRAFRHEQAFDFDGVRGRLMSSSYAPAAGHPNHEPMLAELRALFDAHNESGHVRFDYETEVYVGKFES